MTSLQQQKGNKIAELKRRRDTTVNLMKGNPELTAKSQEKINELKKKQDLIIEGKRIKPYTFDLTDAQAKKAVFMRKVGKAQMEKKRASLSTIPGPPLPKSLPPPHFFLPPKKDRTRKRQFPQQIIVRGGRRTRRKRRNRKRKTKKKRRKRRTKKKRRKRRRKTRRY